MKKLKLPKCPICEKSIEAPHESCQIKCFECGKIIPSLNYYLINEGTNEIFRFCSTECVETHIEKHKEGNEND